MEGNLCKSSPSIQTTDASNSPEVHFDGAVSRQHESNRANVDYDTLQHLSGIGPDEVEYRMDHKSRGKVLIFNHNTFDNMRLHERIGTDVDNQNIQSTFKQLGFQVDPYNDLTCEALQKKATAVANEDHSNRSCLVVVVMTHGGEDGFLAAKDQTYNIEVLLSCFFAGRCPSMTGKPKIFFIQACRGENLSEPFQVHYDTRLATTCRFYSIPGEADVLLAYGTYPGCKSHREACGSWFIQELCKELRVNADKLDMVSMLTNVTRHIAIKKEYCNKKQIPVLQSTLTRKLFLHPPTPQQMVQQVSLVYSQETVEQDSVKTKSFNAEQDSALPDLDVLDKLRNGLKLFLQQMSLALTSEVQESGEEILLWISRWDILDQALRYHTLNKLLKYLQSYATEWEYYNLLYFPRS